MAHPVLATDGYKFSMAEAGWPLRREVFYYSHRKGGWQLMPFDAEAWVRVNLPEGSTEDYAYLASHEYEMGVGFKAAIREHAKLAVRAVPRGAWFFDREPVIALSGPSALVSWFEPLLLMLNFRIQVATEAVRDRENAAQHFGEATCDRQRELIEETLDAVGVKRWPVRVDSSGYFERVRATARGLIQIVGSADRIFEVGMRAASCLEQHEIALAACRAEGIRRTSNVLLARKLSMLPVGTMGHEHVQRYGSDEAAFRAMRDRRPNRSSFLLDTFDTLRSGLPHALAVMKEDPAHGDSVRYDSGDKKAQYRVAVAESRRQGIPVVHILEDGFDDALTREFEALRRELDVKESEQVYGYGGYLVARPAPGSRYSRDRVSAVYKLAQTGPHATMKFANEVGGGKESLPGVPEVWRRTQDRGALAMVGQASEEPPAGYARLTGGPAAVSSRELFERAVPEERRLELSPATRQLADDLRRRREQLLEVP